MSSQLDIIIPVYNEADNVSLLLQRISSSLREAKISYHVYFVDDRSTDNTVQIINSLKKKYPLTVLKKKGTQGKAFSILEAVPETTAPYLAMIDADLQYPPEVLPEMLTIATNEGVSVARRNDNHEHVVRKVLSRGFRWFFGKILHGLDCDVQSGLKVFRREIIEQLEPEDVTPWTLDIPLLTNALNLGYTIGEVAITFAKRNSGESKIKFVSSIREIGGQAIKYRFTQKRPFIIQPEKKSSMIGAGLVHKGKRFITHTTLQPGNSALDVVTQKQQLFILSILLVLIASFIILPLGTAKVVVGIMSFIYFMDVVFNFFLILKSLHNPPEISVTKEEIAELKDKDLPIYTILCPLYKEAHVIPQFLESIEKINWPKNKLDVQLLLEEDDIESVEAVKKMKLPKYVRMVVVPDSQPKTKPKACNYGLSLAEGEYVVIYDAEDAPDPEQLKKSFVAFQKVGPNIKCLQAKLNYYNPHQNWLTRLFTAEYSLWFDVILTGMQSIETTIPLGGTSNHFRTADLLELQGWDPFNVTEDADLGVRLFSRGFKTAIIDSTTLEEANSNFKNWLRQRSRWIKGYMQTYLLHMRNPIELAKKQGIHALLFQLTVGGKITFILINPLLWLLTISYFTLYIYVGSAIEALYPSVIFYMAVISLIFGNFMFIYYYMIGAAKRENWTLMKWIYLVPFYWLMVSIAGAIALYQLIVKPHYWEKTIHGLHLRAKEELEEVVEEVSKNAVASVVSQAIEEENVTPAGELNFFSRVRFNAFKKLVGVTKYASNWKTTLNELLRGKYKNGTLLVAASMFANVLNMLTNFYLGNELSVTNFAVFNTYLSIMNVTYLVFGSLSTTVNQRAAHLFGKNNNNSIQQFWNFQKKRIFYYSIILSGLWIIIIPWITNIFHFDTYFPMIFFTPILLFGGIEAVNSGYLRGLLAFQFMAIIAIAEPIARLLSSYVLGEYFSEFAYLSVPIGLITSVSLSYFFSNKLTSKKTANLTQKSLRLPLSFFTLAMTSKLSSLAFFSLDNLFVAHYLTLYETGLYGLMGLLGKMIYFSGSLITGFILPITAYQDGKGNSSDSIFNKLLLLTSFISTLAWITVGVVIPYFASQYFGEKLNAIQGTLPIYSLGILFFTISQAIVQFHLAKKHYLFTVASFLVGFSQLLSLQFFHASLEQVTWVMFISGTLNLIVLLGLHTFYSKLVAPLTNLQDLFDLFFGKIKSLVKSDSPEAKESFRILIFNWRDTKHIWAGGAEAYIQEIAKGLTNQGHKVTIFCGNDGKHPRNEVVDGVQVIRRGGFYTVYFWAFLYYIMKLRNYFDVVIDSENGIPFLTPLYVKKPIYLLIHHVHQEVFRTQLVFPFSEIAAFIEAKVMPYLYRSHKVITVSDSSRDEIIKLGLGDKESISIVHPGVHLKEFKSKRKTANPSLVYVGRLKPYKNINLAICAFAKVLEDHPKAKFYIAGTGESETELKDLVLTLGIEKAVTFMGRIDDKEKASLLGKSWVAIQPSMIEGWGITVIEANASGTPVIASNVKGLRDSINDKETGILVSTRSIDDFSESINYIFINKAARTKMSKNAKQWATKFDWQISIDRFISLIEKEEYMEVSPTLALHHSRHEN